MRASFYLEFLRSKSGVVILLSVLLNISLLIAVIHSRRPSIDGDLPERGGGAAPASIGSKPGGAPVFPERKALALGWQSLNGQDMMALASDLRAAGFPAHVIVEVLRSEREMIFNARVRPLKGLAPDEPFWLLPSRLAPAESGGRYAKMDQINREIERTFRGIVSEPFFAEYGLEVGQRRMWGNLSRQSLTRLQRIEDDYAEMADALRIEAKGVEFAADRERLALLEREKYADIAAMLDPVELAEYLAYTSPITAAVKRQLGAFDPTPGEYSAVMQAQMSFNELFKNEDFRTLGLEQKQEGYRQFEARLKASLGDVRYAEFQRATMPDFQQLVREVERDGLPRDAAVAAFNVADQVSILSNNIVDDRILTPAEKQVALQELARNARVDLAKALGPLSGTSFAKSTGLWLDRMAERGVAVSFNPLVAVGTASNEIVVRGDRTPVFRAMGTANAPSPNR